MPFATGSSNELLSFVKFDLVGMTIFQVSNGWVEDVGRSLGVV